jgi:hypothetical protein
MVDSFNNILWADSRDQLQSMSLQVSLRNNILASPFASERGLISYRKALLLDETSSRHIGFLSCFKCGTHVDFQDLHNTSLCSGGQSRRFIFNLVILESHRLAYSFVQTSETLSGLSTAIHHNINP